MENIHAEDCFSGRTLATTTTMYRHENGRTYHAYRKSNTQHLSELHHTNDHNQEMANTGNRKLQEVQALRSTSIPLI